MPSDADLERLLREARSSLPEPDADTTEVARRQAIGALRIRRRRKLRALVLAVVALGVAAVLGTTIATALTPNGEASKGPVGLGFVPEPGWYALQAPTRMPVDRPAVAMAANVPFAQSDVVDGMADSSALPYATLLALPQRGVVIVAASTESTPEPAIFPQYPRRSLPLSLRDATPYIDPGTQLRPEEPLGQYELRARIEGYDVDVQVYFGVRRPGRALLARAERQLEGLVLRTGAPARAQARGGVRASQAAVLDRTVSCLTSPTGGIWQVAPHGSTGTRYGGTWVRLPFGAASSGTVGSIMMALNGSLAWITAGKPAADTTLEADLPNALVREWGTLGISRVACRTSTAKVALSSAGLDGGVASQFGDTLACPAPRRVLVRVHAVSASGGELRARGDYLRTYVPMRSAQLAVRTPTGRPLMYADVVDTGRARLFAAKGCMPR